MKIFEEEVELEDIAEEPGETLWKVWTLAKVEHCITSNRKKIEAFQKCTL